MMVEQSPAPPNYLNLIRTLVGRQMVAVGAEKNDLWLTILLCECGVGFWTVI